MASSLIRLPRRLHSPRFAILLFMIPLTMIAWLTISGGNGSAAWSQEAAPVRVMTFNIRYGTADDGENRWENRREFLIDTIRAFDPDLLGTQETLGFQRDYLAEKLPAYTVLGVGRDDGKERGEMMALYFKRDRFEMLDSGHFWLSETPDVPGSKSWDTSLPRMATWVKLRDKRQPDARPILAINTHFDHRGPVARLESARLLRAQAARLGPDCSWIVTGDFNTAPDSEPYTALFGPIDGTPSPLLDSYRAVHPQPDERGEATYSNFDPNSTRGSRIDWIGVTGDWKITSVEIDRTQRDGRLPSDHYPINAVFSR